MGADGAEFWGLLADMDMPAVGALPDNHVVAYKHGVGFHSVYELAVSFLVFLFNGGHHLKQSGDFGKSFFPCGFGEAGIHVGPFVVFTGGGVVEVCQSRGNIPVVEELEPDFCVFLFVVCRFFKEVCYLIVTLFSGFAGVIGVLVSCLGFPRKSGKQIFFRFLYL